MSQNNNNNKDSWKDFVVLVGWTLLVVFCVSILIVLFATWLKSQPHTGIPPLLAVGVTDLFKTSTKMKTVDRWQRDLKRRKITEAVFGRLLVVGMVAITLFIILIVMGAIPICFLSNQTVC